MSIIHRYITREIVKYFSVVLCIVIAVYLAVDFFEKIDNFMEVNLPLARSVEFFLYKIPFIIAQITPIAILLGVVITFGLMNRHNEILAVKGGGGSTGYMFKPALVIGVVLSVFLFFFSELVVPVTVSRSNWIWHHRDGSSFSSSEKNIWIKDHRAMIHIRYFNPGDQSISGITGSWFDEDFKLVRRVDAEKGLYSNGRWILSKAMEQRLEPKTRVYRVVFLERLEASFEFVPEDLRRVVRKSEEMSFFELLNYIRKVENEGYDATVYRVDLNAKLAYPLVCLIMVMVGTALAVRNAMKDSLAVGIVYGIGIAFVYWIFYSFCVSLGYGKIVPPVIAAWTANFVFLSVGGVMLLRAE